MAIDPQYNRKICPSYKQEFSNRHALRHTLECTNHLTLPPTDKNVNTSVDYVDQHLLHEEEISDNEIYIDYNQYRIDVSPRMQTTNNLGDEDINAYYDVYIDSSENEITEDFSDFDEYECTDEGNFLSMDTDETSDRQILNKKYVLVL